MSTASTKSLSSSALTDRVFANRRGKVAKSGPAFSIPGSFHGWMITLTLLALTGSIYLAVVAFSSGAVAGCGSEAVFDCNHVLSSRWSTVLGVPVSVPAILLHATVLGLLVIPTRSSRVATVRWSLITWAEFAAAFGALWFIGLQIFVLQHLCFYCLAIHGCGLAMASLILWQRPAGRLKTWSLAGAALLPVVALAMTQMLTDGPDKFELVEMKGGASSELSSSGQVVGGQTVGDRAIATEPAELLEFEPPVVPLAPKPGNSELRDSDMDSQSDTDDGNIFDAPVTTPTSPVSLHIEQVRLGWSRLAVLSAPQSLLFGQVTTSTQPEQAKRRTVTILNNLALDVTQWPIVGKPTAEFVVVEMLDYTCVHCQNTHAAVHGAREQLGDRLAVIVLPVPLSAGCNQHVRTTHVDHAEACELANVAIAVWRVRPEAFEEFHGWLLTTKPRYAQAWERAAETCGEQLLRKEIDSGVPAAFVTKNVNLYERAQRGALPKILFPSTAAVGEMRSANTLISLIQNHAAR